MSNEQKLREAFEAYITDNGKWPNAILKAPGGQYLLLRTSVAWQDWRACAEALAPAPAQEPVAWLVSLPNEPELGEWFSEKDMGELGYTSKPLYTSPQEVGLTDEEIDTIASKYISMVGDHWCNEEAIRERHAEDFARAIIAALRAKGVV